MCHSTYYKACVRVWQCWEALVVDPPRHFWSSNEKIAKDLFYTEFNELQYLGQTVFLWKTGSQNLKGKPIPGERFFTGIFKLYSTSITQPVWSQFVKQISTANFVPTITFVQSNFPRALNTIANVTRKINRIEGFAKSSRLSRSTFPIVIITPEKRRLGFCIGRGTIFLLTMITAASLDRLPHRASTSRRKSRIICIEPVYRLEAAIFAVS